MSEDGPQDDDRCDGDQVGTSRDRRIGAGALAFGGLAVAALAFVGAAVASGPTSVGFCVFGTFAGIAGPLIAMMRSGEVEPMRWTPSPVSWWEDAPRGAEPPFCERCPDMPPMYWQERVRYDVEPCAGYDR